MIREINLAPLNSYISVCDLGSWMKIAQRHHLPHAELEDWAGVGGCFYWFDTNMGKVYYMVLGEYNIDTLYHEAIHAVYQMMNDAGVLISPDNHEMLTYGVNYLVEQIRTRFYKQKRQAFGKCLAGQYEAAQLQDGNAQTTKSKIPKMGEILSVKVYRQSAV